MQTAPWIRLLFVVFLLVALFPLLLVGGGAWAQGSGRQVPAEPSDAPGETGKPSPQPPAETPAPQVPDASPATELTAAEREVLKAAPGLLGKKQYSELEQALAPLMDSAVPEGRWTARYYMGRSYQQQRDYSKALGLLQQVADNYPPLLAEAHYWLGQTWIGRRRYETARRCFSAAADHAGDDFLDDCRYQTAYTFFLEQRYEAACKLLSEFLATYPESPQAKSAQTILERAQERLTTARRVAVNWVANIGLNSLSERIRWDEELQLSLGASGRVGAQLAWQPKDGMRMRAHTYATRTAYFGNETSDRSGLSAGLSVTHDLGDTHSVSYGLSHSTNTRVNVINSDSATTGLWGSYSFPIRTSERLSLSMSLSDLHYYAPSSSGTSQTFSAGYSRPLSPVLSMSARGSYAHSRVGADYLSYAGPAAGLTLSQRLNTRGSVSAGFSYSGRAFAAPAPRATELREDHIRRVYAQYSHRLTNKVSVTVGWQQTSGTSTAPSLDRIDSNWYIGATNLLGLTF